MRRVLFDRVGKLFPRLFFFTEYPKIRDSSTFMAALFWVVFH